MLTYLRTVAEPIALQLRSATGNFIHCQIFTAFMYLAASLCLLVLRQLKMKEILQKEKDAEKLPAYTAGVWSLPFTNGRFGIHRV